MYQQPHARRIFWPLVLRDFLWFKFRVIRRYIWYSRSCKCNNFSIPNCDTNDSLLQNNRNYVITNIWLELVQAWKTFRIFPTKSKYAGIVWINSSNYDETAVRSLRAWPVIEMNRIAREYIAVMSIIIGRWISSSRHIYMTIIATKKQLT